MRPMDANSAYERLDMRDDDITAMLEQADPPFRRGSMRDLGEHLMIDGATGGPTADADRVICTNNTDFTRNVILFVIASDEHEYTITARKGQPGEKALKKTGCEEPAAWTLHPGDSLTLSGDHGQTAYYRLIVSKPG
jgi:hypothetical protein